MSRLTRWTRRILFALLALAIVATGGYLVLDLVASSRLERELEKIRAAGEPLTLAEMALPPVPDSENAGIPLTEAFDAMEALEADGEWDEAVEDALSSLSDHETSLDEEQAKLVATWLEARAEIMTLLDAATDRTACRLPVDDRDGPFRLPRIQGFTEARRVYAARAAMAARGDRPAEAFETHRRMLRLGRLLEGEATLIALLIRQSIEHDALARLPRLVTRFDADEATCSALLAEIRRVDVAAASRRALLGERCFGQAVLDLLTHDPGSMPDWGGETPRWIPAPVFKLERARHLKLIGCLIDLSARPMSEDRDAWQRLDEASQDVPWYGVLFGDCVAPLMHLWPRIEEHRARLEVAAIALAIRIHEIRHGSLPATLDDLDADVLAPIPVDACSSEPYRYRPDPDGGYLLYGVGRNGVDDGGADPTEDDDEPGDVVWRQPPRE